MRIYTDEILWQWTPKAKSLFFLANLLIKYRDSSNNVNSTDAKLNTASEFLDSDGSNGEVRRFNVKWRQNDNI